MTFKINTFFTAPSRGLPSVLGEHQYGDSEQETDLLINNRRINKLNIYAPTLFWKSFFSSVRFSTYLVQVFTQKIFRNYNEVLTQFITQPIVLLLSQIF